jgi:hypothetical protein
MHAVEIKIRESINGMCVRACFQAHTRHLGLGVLSAEVLGGIDHVGEGTLDLIPLAGLETAVGVDPELLRADC